MEEHAQFADIPNSTIGVSVAEARAELDRLLADPEFRCSDRNRNFLRFVAEEALAGRGQSIKAYTIAVDVFGRPTSFDASTDPIVRIEATRLRAAMVRYYEHRPRCEIRIELPKGRYVPLFYREKRGRGAVDVEDDSIAETGYVGEEQPASPSRLSPTRGARWLAGALGISGGLALGAVLLYPSYAPDIPAQRVSERPLVAVEFGHDDAVAAESAGVHDAMLVALARFQSMRILSTDTTPGIPGKSRSPDYRIIVTYRAGVAELAFRWQVIDVDKGEAVEFGETQQTVSSPPSNVEIDDLLRKLALRLASSSGVINSHVLAKEAEHPTLGFGCTLRAYKAWQTRDEQESIKAKRCLQQTIAAQPSYVEAKGMLALFMTRESSYDAPTASLETALAMVRDASAAAPDSTGVAFARMTLEFLNGRADLAISVGRHALEINPYHGGIAARLAQILYFTGSRDEALSLAQKSSTVDGVVYGDAQITFAFEAYMRGQYATALAHLDRTGRGASYGPSLLRVATLGQIGSSGEIAAVRNLLLENWPRFEKTFYPMMDRLETEASLVDALAEGLGKAGLNLSKVQ